MHSHAPILASFAQILHKENQGDGGGLAERMCRTNERLHFQFVSYSQQDARVSETILAHAALSVLFLL